MQTWWTSLGTPLQVFYAIALATSLMMVLQLLAMLLGFDGEGEAEGAADMDIDEGGAHIFSVRSVTAFFVGFGWAGVASLEGGLALGPSVGIAAGTGAVFMGGVLALMRFLYGLRYSGTLDYHNAIGRVGTVYLRVPAAMAGTGKIEVLVQGRLRVVDALTRSPAQIANQARVRVVELVGDSTLLVEPLEPATEAEAKEE